MRNAVTDEATRGADDGGDQDVDADAERQSLEDLGREGDRLEEEYDRSQEPYHRDRRRDYDDDERDGKLASNGQRREEGRDSDEPSYGKEVNTEDRERARSRSLAERERRHAGQSRIRRRQQDEQEEEDEEEQEERYDSQNAIEDLPSDDAEYEVPITRNRHRSFRRAPEDDYDGDGRAARHRDDIAERREIPSFNEVGEDDQESERRNEEDASYTSLYPDASMAGRKWRGDDYNEQERHARHQRRSVDGESVAAVTTTRDPFKFVRGDKVRAFHEGQNVLQDATVQDINNDGTITVTWDNGDTTHRTMRSDSVFRPVNPDPQDAYRLEGPNAFDMAKERKNIAAGLAIGPSKRKTKAEIYDGETLFPPSMLTEENRGRMKHRPAPALRPAPVHTSMLRSEVVDD
jgi:hypothetical protein